jgi:subtilisin family serine protease
MSVRYICRVLYVFWYGLSLFLFAQSCTDEVGPPSAKTSETVARVQEKLVRALEATDDTVAVIVNFREPTPAPVGFYQRRENYRSIRESLLSNHREGLVVSRRFSHVPAFAGRITKSALEKLRLDPRVSYIQLDGTGHGGLKEAVPAIGGDQVQKMYHLTGKGVRVAVLDSGIATSHPDLKDSIVAQHCFTRNDCPPLRSAEGTSAEDDNGHGTHVAGIITSNGVVSSIGFAPNAEIVAVKVDDANDAGQVSDWVAGLDWVYDNLSTLKVKVINLSICSSAMYTDAAQCDQEEPALARAVKNLVDAGVTIFSASGNLGSATTLTAPACNTGVIAVAATYDSNAGKQPADASTYAMRWGFGAVANCGDATTAFDQITCFSNTPARVDLVAPGAPMISDYLNGTTSTFWGTSQASPAAAGVAALMLECNPKLTPANIKQKMIKTGVKRTDAKNNLSFPSLRALDAVRAACPGLAASDDAGVAGRGGGDGAAGGQAGVGVGVGVGGAAGYPVVNGSGGYLGLTAGNTGLSSATNGAGGAAGIFEAIPMGTGRGAGVGEGCGCSVPGGHCEHGTRNGAWLAAIGLLLVFFRKRSRSVCAAYH